MNAHPARDIAEQILWVRKDGPTTTMQVLKLSYICHGWMLGIHGEPLVSDPVMAWRYGPVIPDIYRLYKSFGGNPIDTVPVDKTNMLDGNQASLIKAVLNSYREFTAWQLSAITHKPGTPWDQVYNGDGGIGAIIPNNMIKKYYEKLAKG